MASTAHIPFLPRDVSQGNRTDAHILPAYIICLTDLDTYY